MTDTLVIIVSYNTRELTLQAVAAARKAAAGLDAPPACALVGPALAYPDGMSQASAKHFPTLGVALGEVLGVHRMTPRNRWVRRFYYGGRDLARDTVVDTVSGAVMLLRADAFA